MNSGDAFGKRMREEGEGRNPAVSHAKIAAVIVLDKRGLAWIVGCVGEV